MMIEHAPIFGSLLQPRSGRRPRAILGALPALGSLAATMILAVLVGAGAGCIGDLDDEYDEYARNAVTINWKVNGYTLTAREKQWMAAFASRVVPRMADYYGSTSKALDEASKAAWWSLKEGVMHQTAWPPSYSNCNYTTGDKHIGPFTVCPSGRAWQVGLSGVQVHYNSASAFENAARKCYPGQSIAEILQITADEARVDANRVKSSTGDLRKSWFARNSCAGSVIEAAVVHRECIAGSKSWCASKAWYPSSRYSPTLSDGRKARLQVRDLLTSLYAAKVDYIDVLPNHTFFSAIKWFRRNVGGSCGAGGMLFCPNRALTRGEMATFLVRALKLPPATRDYFTDDDGSTHEANINRIREAGITSGCNPPTNTHFCPTRNLTRAEMATFLVRALGLPPTSRDYFTDDDGSVHEGNINRVAAAGITLGCNPPTNTRFCPNDKVTRGQLATFLQRALD